MAERAVGREGAGGRRREEGGVQGERSRGGAAEVGHKGRGPQKMKQREGAGLRVAGAKAGGRRGEGGEGGGRPPGPRGAAAAPAQPVPSCPGTTFRRATWRRFRPMWTYDSAP